MSNRVLIVDDGLGVCRRLRRQLAHLPVVRLTALGDEAFSPREFVLRIRSVLRRAATSARRPG